MGLNVLDFLSSSPNSYIFQSTSNKTNFGGVCQLLSIILILGFAIYYLIIYFKKDDYSIEYSSYMYDINHRFSDEDKKFEFGYDIFSQGYYSNNKELVSKNFSLMKVGLNETIPRNVVLSENIRGFDYFLVYKCQDDKCEIDEKFFLDRFYVYFEFKMDNYDLQSNYPISSYYAPIQIPIFINDFIQYMYFFEESICTTFGFFGNKKESILIPKNYEYITAHLNLILEKGNIKYKALSQITFILNDDNWDQYKRTKKSIFDTLSNICSLGLTIYNAFKNGFLLLYSRNFNNYKIIQTILSGKDEKLKHNKKIATTKEMKTLDNNSSDILLSKPSNYDNNNDEMEEQNIDNEKMKITYEEMPEEPDINFPKLSFFSYIFNIIYCHSCCDGKNQKFISKCNEIVSKYYSVENILYNQILIENLIKDYTWNDPRLKKVENNELINNLKIYIRNNYFNANG